MPYSTPSVDDFKSQFPRDFPYAVPAWGAAGTLIVSGGAVVGVRLKAGGQGYKTVPQLIVDDITGTGAVLAGAIANGSVTGLIVINGGSNYQNPTLTISGGAGDNTDLTRVTDNDISGAIFDAQYNVNQALFDGQAQFSRAFLYLAAHNLVEKLLAAGEGLASQYNWLTASKAVGSVQESFQVPERISKDPMLSAYSKTRYGALYLQIISPLLIGGVFTSYRRTLP